MARQWHIMPRALIISSIHLSDSIEGAIDHRFLLPVRRKLTLQCGNCSKLDRWRQSNPFFLAPNVNSGWNICLYFYWSNPPPGMRQRDKTHKYTEQNTHTQSPNSDLLLCIHVAIQCPCSCRRPPGLSTASEYRGGEYGALSCWGSMGKRIKQTPEVIGKKDPVTPPGHPPSSGGRTFWQVSPELTA